MTDTATNSTNTPNPGAKRGFDVNYTLEIVDELPEGGRPGGFGQSPLEVQLNKVREAVQADPSVAGKWMLIGRYGKPTAGSAAANVLRIRHGRDISVEGYEFAVRPIDGGENRGLFVRYDPSRIVDGAKAEHERFEKERLARLERQRAEREAAKANGGTGGASEAGGAGDPNADARAKAQAAAKKAATK